MKVLKILLHTIKLVFYEKFCYKKAILLDILSTLISIFIYYFLWSVIYKRYSDIGGYTQIQMTTYIIMARILSNQFNGGINQTISNWIYEGQIGIELLRPITLIGNLFYRKIGEFVSFFVLKAIPIYLVSVLVLDANEVQNIYNVFFFVISILLAIVVLFEVEFIIGILSIFTLYDYGLRTVKTVLISILSGALVPINILPHFLRKIVEVLPFDTLVRTPINIFLGAYTIEKNIDKLYEQSRWAVFLGIMMWYSWKKLRKYIIVQGG